MVTLQDRLLRELGILLKRNWITLALVVCLAGMMLISLNEAHWVADNEPLMWSLVLGLGFGWLLARSRFHRWFIALYALVISVIFPLQGLGHFLPSMGEIFGTPPGEVIAGMNLRAVTLYLRATGWVETLQSGKNIKDSGLFALLLGFILALCGIWLVWALMRQRRALNGLLPAGILMAINVHLTGQPLSYYAFFLFSAFLLIARESFNERADDWARRGVDYPEYLGLDWAGSAAALAIVIVVVTRLVPLFGTPEGWHILSEWARRTQQTTSNTVTRLFSGVNAPPQPPAKKVEFYANPPDLGEVGVPISQGDQTVMWVSLSDAPPPPQGIQPYISTLNIPIHYWRSGIFAIYTGRGWMPAPLNANSLPGAQLSKSPPPGRYFLTQNFSLEAKTSGTLFAVNDPLLTSTDVAMHATQLGDSRVLQGQVQNYQVISEATQITEQQLIHSPRSYPIAIQEMYLQLPDSLPERVGSLARRVTAGASDPYHQALAIQTYLRKNYPYDLNVPPPAGNRDVVDYFLFDAPGGFCSHYASAMAVMLRVVGVPARVAAGYAMGEFDAPRQAYRVPVSAAHAWVEVYFTGYGWIEFEPTAARNPITYISGATQNKSAPALSSAKPQAETKNTSPVLLIILVTAGVLLVLFAPALLLRAFRQEKQATGLQVDALYRRMRRVLTWTGFESIASLTPDEYLALYAAQLKPYGTLNQALDQATALYRETVYSPRAPDVQRVRRVNWLWQHSARDLAVLWIRKAWQNLREKAT